MLQDPQLQGVAAEATSKPRAADSLKPQGPAQQPVTLGGDPGVQQGIAPFPLGAPPAALSAKADLALIQAAAASDAAQPCADQPAAPQAATPEAATPGVAQPAAAQPAWGPGQGALDKELGEAGEALNGLHVCPCECLYILASLHCMPMLSASIFNQWCG